MRTGAVRAKLLFWSFALLAAFLVARLYIIQIREGPLLAARAREQRLDVIPLGARRGTIYDRDGNALARSLPSQSVYVTPREIDDQTGTARALGAALGISPARILTRIRSGGSFVAIERKAPREGIERVAKLDLAGVSVVPEETGVRFIPSGRLASTVLGFTGIDENGLDGAEYEFDELLLGKPGRMMREDDSFHRALPFAPPRVLEPARSGYDLVLTLDSYLQYNVERVLRSTVSKFGATSGSAIVMDPWSGEVLAIANVPDYDVRHWDRSSDDERRDRAIEDAYEPGSTFKLITAAAALDSGKVTTADRFPARDTLAIGDHVIHNAEDGFMAGTGGSETLGDIVAYSHNVGAAEVGLAIGPKTMYAELERFGFGARTQVELPGENPGIVLPLDEWSATSLPTIAFGHGIATTPLALARAYCAIANGGLLMRPRILDEIVAPDGHVVYRYGAEVERRAISAKTAAILRGFLRAVVVRGTGDPAAQVAGYKTAGKTGTAQVAANGRYVPGQYVASFVGYVPAERPRFVILVKVERPRGLIYGSEVAAPAFAEIARLAMLHAGVAPVESQSRAPNLVKDDRAAKNHP